MKRVALIDKPHPYLIEQLNSKGFTCEEVYNSTFEELKPLLANYTGIVIRSRFTLDESFLNLCPQLRFIARMGIGLEHVDLDYAHKQGIKVFNSPEGSRDTASEHTLGLILGLLHHLNRSHLEIRQGIWDRKSNRGHELRHRTVGIIGYGNIGQAVAQRLSGFGCKVLAYDKFREHYGDEYATAVSLGELQAQADVVTVHIPYADYNHYFINAAFLSTFQQPIFLVNTARGLVLNTADLVEALKSGKVIGAALDVLEYEEQAFNVLKLDSLPAAFQYLRSSPNVILTPHTAGLSLEVMEAHARVLVEKITTFIS
jgi:D-3-phosphoglycerate dehydrogenase